MINISEKVLTFIKKEIEKRKSRKFLIDNDLPLSTKYSLY